MITDRKSDLRTKKIFAFVTAALITTASLSVSMGGLYIIDAIADFDGVANAQAVESWKTVFANPQAVIDAFDGDTAKSVRKMVETIQDETSVAKQATIFQKIERKVLRGSAVQYQTLPDDLKNARENLATKYGETSAEVTAFDAAVQSLVNTAATAKAADQQAPK